MANWYAGSVDYTNVAQWAALTVYLVGDLRRQLAAPTVGNERVFRCTTAGTSGAAEPTWTLTKGSTTTDSTAVWTEVTGNNTYAWTAPHARLRNALAWAAAGDDVFLAKNSAATEATAVTYTSPGTAASPCRILSVDSSLAAPPTAVASGAVETTTGSSVMTWTGFAYWYGITWNMGTGSTPISSIIGNASAHGLWFDTCTFAIVNTASTSAVFIGAGPTTEVVEWVNCIVSFANAGQAIKVRTRFSWTGTASATAGTVPTTLFLSSGTGAGPGIARVIGVDLSALGSGKSWVDNTGTEYSQFYFQDCKAGSSVTFTTGAVVNQGGVITLVVNCDSANTNYRFYYEDYAGKITQETTIVRTGGATDGTTPVSRKMVSSANAKLYAPLRGGWIEYWNDSTASLTLTVPVITDNVTLTNADAWLEVEYQGTASFPLGVFSNNRVADALTTAANQPTDSTSTWTTTGLGTPVKQSLAVTITPTGKGPIRARVVLAKPSVTMYYDPLILPGSWKQYMAGEGVYMNGGALPVAQITGARSIGTY